MVAFGSHTDESLMSNKPFAASLKITAPTVTRNGQRWFRIATATNKSAG